MSLVMAMYKAGNRRGSSLNMICWKLSSQLVREAPPVKYGAQNLFLTGWVALVFLPIPLERIHVYLVDVHCYTVTGTLLHVAKTR